MWRATQGRCCLRVRRPVVLSSAEQLRSTSPTAEGAAMPPRWWLALWYWFDVLKSVNANVGVRKNICSTTPTSSEIDLSGRAATPPPRTAAAAHRSRVQISGLLELIPVNSNAFYSVAISKPGRRPSELRTSSLGPTVISRTPHCPPRPTLFSCRTMFDPRATGKVPEPEPEPVPCDGDVRTSASAPAHGSDAGDAEFHAPVTLISDPPKRQVCKVGWRSAWGDDKRGMSEERLSRVLKEI